jgi:hypothetical protein
MQANRKENCQKQGTLSGRAIQRYGCPNQDRLGAY